MISHGSGGIGNAETYTATYFLNLGFKVAIIDYFKPYNIKNLWWNYEEKFQDAHSIPFIEMLNLSQSFNEKIIHIGFSLGGLFGILNADKFELNFCFYPGIMCVTESIIQRDYKNTTIFVAENDTWCDGYQNLSKMLLLPPTEIILKNQYHGFMIPKKDKHITIAKYNFPKISITDEIFNNLRPNHKELSEKFGYIPITVHLKHDDYTRNFCLNLIKEQIKKL